jgi:serine protease inhibitor
MGAKKIIAVMSAILVVLAVLLYASGCCLDVAGIFKKTPKETEANRQSDKMAEGVDQGLVSLNTDFALKIFKELSNEDKYINVFISPISISIASAIAYNGAKNSTQQEIAETLEFKDYGTEKLNSSFKDLISSMTDIDEMVQLYTGNSIWLEKDFNVEKNFIGLAGNYYNASIYNEDFNTPGTADKINNWVSDATEGKITKITDSAALKDAVMYLVNAIYFKGEWKDKFKAEDTMEDDFFLIDKNIKKVQMMSNIKKYDYYEGDDFQMIRMPYGRDKAAMYVLLTREGIDINDFINSLSRDLLNDYISGAVNTEAILKFPKFNIEYGAKSLVEPLKNLGMADAFSVEKADFSSISPLVYISKIEHKAIIEVNEEGTVAAAASSFGMGATAVRPVDFIVNRPFVLLIRDDRTGNILFIGKILEP